MYGGQDSCVSAALRCHIQTQHLRCLVNEIFLFLSRNCVPWGPFAAILFFNKKKKKTIVTKTFYINIIQSSVNPLFRVTFAWGIERMEYFYCLGTYNQGEIRKMWEKSLSEKKCRFYDSYQSISRWKHTPEGVRCVTHPTTPNPRVLPGKSPCRPPFHPK